MMLWLCLALVIGCADEDPPEAPPAEAPAEEAPKAEAPKTNVSAQTQALYDACGARVEGAQSAGECQADADCAPAGCSQELCVPLSVAAAGLNTPCDAEPCFQVLDACGCHEGMCTWTLKDAAAPTAPAGGTRLMQPGGGKRGKGN